MCARRWSLFAVTFALVTVPTVRADEFERLDKAKQSFLTVQRRAAKVLKTSLEKAIKTAGQKKEVVAEANLKSDLTAFTAKQVLPGSPQVKNDVAKYESATEKPRELLEKSFQLAIAAAEKAANTARLEALQTEFHEFQTRGIVLSPDGQIQDGPFQLVSALWGGQDNPTPKNMTLSTALALAHGEPVEVDQKALGDAGPGRLRWLSLMIRASRQTFVIRLADGSRFVVSDVEKSDLNPKAAVPLGNGGVQLHPVIYRMQQPKDGQNKKSDVTAKFVRDLKQFRKLQFDAGAFGDPAFGEVKVTELRLSAGNQLLDFVCAERTELAFDGQ